MKLSKILSSLALACTALAKDIKSKGKCTTALEGETGCSIHAWNVSMHGLEAHHAHLGTAFTPGWGYDKVVICRNGHWDVLVKCASRQPCRTDPEAWCHSRDGQNLPKEAFELWMGNTTSEDWW